MTEQFTKKLSMFTYLKQVIVVWLIKKIQKYGPREVRVLGKTYHVSEQVFNPKFYYTSEFMAKHIKVRPDDIVLDMGTGSGIQAVMAGRMARKVIAVDINPEAVRFAAANVRKNKLENVVTVIQGDLFSPLNQADKFNVILFTPPYLEGRLNSHFDHALFDPDKALAVKFFKDAGKHLEQDGYVQMVYSSIAGPDKILEIAELSGWKHTLVTREKTFTEDFLIYKLTLN